MSKKVHIKTYGCQMNVYDSVRMADVLAPEGYETTDDMAQADLVLLNTCHIREKAAEKVYSELGRIRKLKEALAAEGKQMRIGVAGCVAQAEGEEIVKRTPYVDMVIGSQSYHELPKMLKALESANSNSSASSSRNKAIHLDFPEIQKFDLLPETRQPQGVSAFVSIQEGCDKFCTFCVVPYTRGAEYSRPVAIVEEEVREQVAAGALEVTLLGQNVNAYHGEATDGSEWGLGRLLLYLSEIDGLERLRFTTSHPRDMDDELIDAFGKSEKIMPYFHLPIQSGSDRILKMMNRGHTAAQYIGIMERLRTVRPDIAFSGDFIVGFPGETDADFEATMRVVETVGYASAYSFKYSPRPGTPAAEKQEQIEENVKVGRLAQLQELLNTQQAQFNAWTVGMRYGVILDRPGKHNGQLVGRSPYMQAVHVDNAAHLLGQLVEVDILTAGPNSVSGVLVKS